MERSILAVEPVHRGWVVRLNGLALEVRATKIEAIGVASARAAERHAMSGDPTGVSVRLHTGSTVLIARHGWAGMKSRRSLR